MYRLIGTTEAAKRLGISPETLRRWAKQGRIKAAEQLPTGVLRFDPLEVERIKRSFKV